MQAIQEASFLVDAQFEQKALRFASQWEVCLATSGKNGVGYGQFQDFLAIGLNRFATGEAALRITQEQTNLGWFGWVSYSYRTFLEQVPKQREAAVPFPPAFFFEPEVLLRFTGDTCQIKSVAIQPADLFQQIQAISMAEEQNLSNTQAVSRVDFQQYQTAFDAVQAHIQAGDLYETNLCIDHRIQVENVDFLQLHHRLMEESPMPFAAYVQYKEASISCASPERFFKVEGSTILSQPIKGTARRSHSLARDTVLRNELATIEKERVENVMIVDLVRNDLSRIAHQVQVSELCKVYTLSTVHQMVSTVVGTLKKKETLAGILRALFPMGSMTGAPKISALTISDRVEQFERGLYSGTIGYVLPDGHMDFNVVIRSMLYHAKEQILHFPTGSAITHYAQAASEYEECLLKAKSIETILAAYTQKPF